MRKWRMSVLAVFLLAGISGSVFANHCHGIDRGAKSAKVKEENRDVKAARSDKDDIDKAAVCPVMEKAFRVRKAGKKEYGKEALCPVMEKGHKVKKGTTVVECGDSTYYLCCPGCLKEVEKNPKKYICPEEKSNECMEGNRMEGCADEKESCRESSGDKRDHKHMKK